MDQPLAVVGGRLLTELVDVTSDLAPNVGSLDAARSTAVRAVILVNFFGFAPANAACFGLCPPFRPPGSRSPRAAGSCA